jgi:hypothetical protein
MWRPRAPHLAHTILLANDGTSTSSVYFDTSISPWWRQASLRQDAIRFRTPKMAHVAKRHRRAGSLLSILDII